MIFKMTRDEITALDEWTKARPIENLMVRMGDVLRVVESDDYECSLTITSPLTEDSFKLPIDVIEDLVSGAV